MIESIYEKIKKDFEFLKDFGYNTCSDEHHYIFPSVVFHSQKESIQIGMNYEEKKMFAWFYSSPKQHIGTDILQNIALGGNPILTKCPKLKSFYFNF